jgi:hypothetical protein
MSGATTQMFLDFAKPKFYSVARAVQEMPIVSFDVMVAQHQYHRLLKIRPLTIRQRGAAGVDECRKPRRIEAKM